MHLENEIAAQPDVLRQLIANETENIGHIARAIRDFNPAFVSIAARGTSDNAARYAQYVLGSRNRLPVALAAPSLHTLYETPPDLSRALVIGISQSGRSVDVAQVIQDARDQGALTLALTNDGGSPMAEAAAHHICLNAGEEKAVAATKTYTAQLTAVAMLSAALSGEGAGDVARLPDWAAETLTHAGEVQAERYRYMDQGVTLGRGFNYATAFEINLKIKELCAITTVGYSEADFRHGPIAMIHRGFPAIAVAAAGKTLPVMRDLIEKLRGKGAELLVIANDEDAFTHAQQALRIPALPEWLSPVVAVIPGQVFALRLARVKGYDVDQPEGLTKVTVTR